MKKITNFAYGVFMSCAAVFFCAGCAAMTSLVDKGGRVLDGSAFVEKKVAVYQTKDMEVREVQNRAGEHSLIITLKQYPAIRVRTSAPDDLGNVYLTSLDYLGGYYHGWNEYRLDLSGTGTAVLGEHEARLAIGGIEPVEISSGRIRRYDTRLTGTEALTSLRNRRERISALAEWLNSRADSPGGPALKDFEQHWKPVLFPEIAARKTRPADWRQAGDQWVKAEDIRWNSGYTERVFPEELRTVRDSGTMLRDWEEAVSWIYNEYNWNTITEQLAAETTLKKK